MYRQPMYTGQQRSVEQPNFCSSLINKIWSHKRSPEVRDRGKSPKKKNQKSDNSDKNEIKSITAKLKRITSTLPWALRSNDAYATGEKNCEICSMTKEKYKSDLHSAKVVGILVDGVVEKEQAENMDEDDDQEEIDEDKNTPKDDGKGDKISFNLSIYCEGDVIKHNLKCLLIKLQKTLGDIMVQICFVKTRKLGNEEKYKKFNVSVSDLKLLKYEYTNLTDAIIPLFKNPSAKKKGNTEVCVACVKEKLCEYNVRLGEILKSGRNLRVVMRNDGVNQDSDKCCSRDYPHVHAEVQGKPIVLKYSMPFQVKPPSKPYEPPDDQMQMDPSEKTVSSQESMEQQEDVREQPSSQEVPYYEWPEDFQEKKDEDTDQEKKDEDSNVNPNLSISPERTYPTDSESPDSSEDTPEDNPKVPESFLQALKGIQPNDDELNSPKTKSSPQNSEISSIVSFKNSPLSLSSNKSKEENKPKSPSPLGIKPSTTQVAAPVSSSTSMFSRQSPKSGTPNPQQKKKSISEESDSSESDVTESSKSVKSKQSSLYCGCNYDNAFKKLGSNTKSQPNAKKAKFEDSWSAYSTESSASYLKDDPDKNKDNTFPFKTNNTTAFPVMTTQSSYLILPKQSSTGNNPDELNSHLSEKNANSSGKIPLVEEIDGNNIRPSVNKVDSLVLAKERWSNMEAPSALRVSDSLEDKAVAAAFKTFIDEPKYEIRRVSTTENSTTNFHTKVGHQNKKMELLEHLGRDNLKSVCSPAECCGTNCLDTQNSYTELPFSPSLYSLPLDHSDLEYLSKATGKPISYEDLMLLAEEEIPANNNEWEIQYAHDSRDQNKPRWLRAFGESDEQKENSNSITTTQTNAHARRSVVIKEEPRLSTIVEEGVFCFSEDETPSIPYMPSIPSLPLEEEEKAELIKKHRPSILKHTTMELRYFTVEFPEIVKNITQQKQTCDKEVKNLNNNTSPQENNSHFEETIAGKTNKVEKMAAFLKSSDSFHSCSSSTELMSVNYEHMERKSVSYNDKLFKRKLDKVTMLNAIHLCDINFDNYNNENTYFSSANNSIEDIIDSKGPNFLERETSYKGCEPEVNDCYVKKLILNENKTQHASINKSYTVIKNNENEMVCYDKMGDTTPQLNEDTTLINLHKSCFVTRDIKKPCEPNRTANCFYFKTGDSTEALNPDSKNILSTNLNVVDKKTSGSKIISVSENTPKYISVKLNQSYTVVKDPKQYTNIKSSLLYKDKPPQMSYTVIKDEEIERTNYTRKDVEKELIITSYPEVENHLLRHHKGSLKFKTDNTPQNDTSTLSHWSKLNVKNYVIEQQKNKETLGLPETKIKHFKDSKRKPLILPHSRFSCRRTHCKVAEPRTCFPTLHPNRINYRIPSLILEPKQLNITFETFKVTNELKQVKINTEQTQHFSGLIFVEDTCKNVLKSEPEKTFVQNTQNKCNFQNLNPFGAAKRNVNNKYFSKSEFNNTLNDARTEQLFSNSLNLNTELLETKDSFHFFTVESTANLKCQQVKADGCKIDEHLLIDRDNNPLYLFDCQGRPLTDQSGRTLQNIKGEFLIIFDKRNNPLCDLNNSPICDCLGHNMNKKGFNSVKPPVEDVLKSFLRESGAPIFLYDIEGRPLTSYSGTTLVDSSGKSLIQFGGTDKPISDSMGRPIYTSTGEQFNGIG